MKNYQNKLDFEMHIQYYYFIFCLYLFSNCSVCIIFFKYNKFYFALLFITQNILASFVVLTIIPSIYFILFLCMIIQLSFISNLRTSLELCNKPNIIFVNFIKSKKFFLKNLKDFL